MELDPEHEPAEHRIVQVADEVGGGYEHSWHGVQFLQDDALARVGLLVDTANHAADPL